MAEKLMLNSTGERIANALQSLVEIQRGGGTIYGFHINGSESNPDSMVTYIEDAVGMIPAYMDYEAGTFNYGSWQNAFFIPKPCMVKYDGTVDYYLNPSDYTKKADGTASDIANTSYEGNAMMEWGQNGKKIYLCVKPSSDGHSADVYIADYKVNDNYHCWSFINHQGKEVDHFYTAIYNGSLVDGKLRSISGQMPCHNTNATTEINYAKANNQGEDVLWFTEEWCDVSLINFLLILISKSTDTQSKFGYGWNGYDDSHPTGEGYYGIKAAGAGNDKGLFYGSNLSTTSGDIVKVFGMENWWGNIWRRFAGLTCNYGKFRFKMTWGTEDGSNVEGYNITGDGYIEAGNETIAGSSGGYSKVMLFHASGCCVLTDASGSSSTYYTDGFYFNLTLTVGYPYRGGHVSYGLHLGTLSLYVGSSPAGANWNIGAAVSLKPPA